MGRFFAAFLLVILSTSVAVAETVTDKEAAIIDKLSNLEGGPIVINGILCVLGIVVTPIIAITFMFLGCLIKAGSQVFTCIAEDAAVGLAVTLTVGGTFCVLDPPLSEQENPMLMQLAGMLADYLI
jgi:hypothetical protein